MRPVLAVIVCACSAALALGLGSAAASTPAVLTFTFPVSNDEPVITWERVEDADRYHVVATFLAVRINVADPFCTAPLAEEQRAVEIDEMFDASEVALDLSQLPPEDAWFLASADVRIEALTAEGVLLAQGAGAATAETLCAATATPPPVLPDTGSGARTNDWSAPLAAMLAAALASSGVGLLALARRRA